MMITEETVSSLSRKDALGIPLFSQWREGNVEFSWITPCKSSDIPLGLHSMCREAKSSDRFLNASGSDLTFQSVAFTLL